MFIRDILIIFLRLFLSQNSMSLKQHWFNFKSNSRFSAKIKLVNNKQIHLVTTIFLSLNLIFFTIIVTMNIDTIVNTMVPLGTKFT